MRAISASNFKQLKTECQEFRDVLTAVSAEKSESLQALSRTAAYSRTDL